MRPARPRRQVRLTDKARASDVQALVHKGYDQVKRALHHGLGLVGTLAPTTGNRSLVLCGRPLVRQLRVERSRLVRVLLFPSVTLGLPARLLPQPVVLRKKVAVAPDQGWLVPIGYPPAELGLLVPSAGELPV